MSNESRHHDDELDAILRVEGRILHEERRIEHELHPHRTTNLRVRFTGAKTMNTVTLQVGQTTTATITPLEADDLTVTPGAVVSNQKFSITDPAVSVIDNPDGTAKITGNAAGTVTGTVSATVTDQDGTVGQFTQGITITVQAAVQSTGRTTQIGVDFSTPAGSGAAASGSPGVSGTPGTNGLNVKGASK